MEPTKNITHFVNNVSDEIKYNNVNTTKQCFANPISDIDNVLFVIFLYVFCAFSGRMVSMVSNTPPPFLGMILAGMVLKCSGVYVLDENWKYFWWYYR